MHTPRSARLVTKHMSKTFSARIWVTQTVNMYIYIYSCICTYTYLQNKYHLYHTTSRGMYKEVNYGKCTSTTLIALKQIFLYPIKIPKWSTCSSWDFGPQRTNYSKTKAGVSWTSRLVVDWRLLAYKNTSEHFLGVPPTQDASHHQDYHMFCGRSQLNLHFPLFARGCGPKQSFIKERTSKHKQHSLTGWNPSLRTTFPTRKPLLHVQIHSKQSHLFGLPFWIKWRDRNIYKTKMADIQSWWKKSCTIWYSLGIQ